MFVYINDINLSLVKEMHILSNFSGNFTLVAYCWSELQPLTLVDGGPTVGHAIFLYFEIICF